MITRGEYTEGTQQKTWRRKGKIGVGTTFCNSEKSAGAAVCSEAPLAHRSGVSVNDPAEFSSFRHIRDNSVVQIKVGGNFREMSTTLGVTMHQQTNLAAK